MIRIDAFDIQDVATRKYFTTRYLGSAGPSRYIPLWVEDYRAAHLRPDREASVERLLDGFAGEPDAAREIWRVQIPVMMVFSYEDGGKWKSADPGFYDLVVRKIRRPCCACCGANQWIGCDGPTREIQRVGDGTWRCEKHVGRNPCAIEGCGKTTKGKQPTSDQYLCGTHWRLAPRRLKLRDRAIWRKAKRHGWDDQLVARYWRNWRCLVERTRRIVHPPKVQILPSSGPAPAALIAELERIGL